MTSPLVLTTLLLAPDPRQTVLANAGPAGFNRQSYSAYGYQHGPTSPRTGFNGQVCEPQGWYHLGNGHRVYNPALMRFHSQDYHSPFGAGGVNGYAYCLGDPINFTDPTGQFVDVLLDWVQPALTLMLNVSLLATGVLTAAATGPGALIGLALWSSRMSVVGATLGIAGATTQMATPLGSTARRVGRAVSAFGTTLAIGGASTRGWLQYQKLKQPPDTPWDKVRDGMRVLFKGPPKTSAPTTTDAAAVSMNVTPPTPTGGPLSGAFPRSPSMGSGAGATRSSGSFETAFNGSPRGSFHSLAPSNASATGAPSITSHAGSVRSHKSIAPDLDG